MNSSDRFLVVEILSCALLLIILACIYSLYSLGFSATFSFDDQASLDGLRVVNDWHSAFLYITTGTSGPLGRPLSLVSFLINAPAYPSAVADFLYTNTLIHLLNVCLLALILARLQHQAPGLIPESPWFIPLTASLWGMLPILASTSMMVVQRMTSLSALFVFLGIWIYLWGRVRADHILPAIITAFGTGLCTLLAMFSKENGVLLPLYLVVLEFTLLSDAKTTPRLWPTRLMRWSILLPSLLVVAYLLSLLPGLASSYDSRSFNLGERLATQAIILWDYLRLGFMPRPLALGPFHDDYQVFQLTDIAALIAILAWLTLILFALFRRRAYPLLTFSILWYCAGHLLESTFIPLELYFEHRNYLPLLGPVIALAAAAGRIPLAWRTKIGIITAYLGFIIFILWQTLSIWGQRDLAAQLWAQTHPNSPRAIHFLTQTYLNKGQLRQAAQLLSEMSARRPDLTDIAIQSLHISCSLNDRQAFDEQLEKTKHILRSGYYGNATLDSLESLRQLHKNGRCSYMQLADLHILADSLLSNPRFAMRPAARSGLHQVKAQLYISDGQLNQTIDHLKQAFEVYPNLNTVSLLFSVLNDSGYADEALKFLDVAITKAPTHKLFLRQKWLSVIDQLRQKALNHE